MAPTLYMQRRRRVLVIALSAVAVAAATLALVAWSDTTRPVLREITVPVPGLSREVTIVQASDVHGSLFGSAQQRVDALLGTRHFDAAVLTGDLESGDVRLSDATRALIRVLAAHSDAVFFVHGDHEASDNDVALSRLGVVNLSVQSQPATIAASAGRVGVMGEFWLLNGPKPPETDALIALPHVPPSADEIEKTTGLTNAVRVFLAGHTHGGQARIPFVGAVWAPVPLSSLYVPSSRKAERIEWFPELQGRTIAGLYRVGDAWVNISAGLGAEHVPIRLFDPAELTIVHLVPAQAAK